MKGAKKHMDYPVPSWRPTRVEPAEWFLSRMAFYTDETEGFVVLKNGTTVFDNSATGPDLVTCRSALLGAISRSPDFSVIQMKDWNYVVRFRGPVYGLVSSELVDHNLPELLYDALKMGLLPSEALLQEDHRETERGHHAIGLYARACLYLDLESQVEIARFSAMGKEQRGGGNALSRPPRVRRVLGGAIDSGKERNGEANQ